MPIENKRLGERIKNLRLQKMMTQKELCGSKITRNMLSAIENGNAMPSVDTLVYIAEKLNVSPGMLLSENESDFSFKKIAVIDSIRQAFARASYSICIELCNGLTEDDEINYILSKSYLSIGKDAFDRGALREMCSLLDKAVYYAERSSYSDGTATAIASRYFKYINNISQTLFSYSISDDRTWVDDSYSISDEFCRYMLAIDTLKGETDINGLPKTIFTFSNQQYIKHIKAVEAMQGKNFDLALNIYKELIYGQTELAIPIMYNIIREAEFCSKELNNYKDAYEFSNSCISILDSLLKQ